MTRFLGSPTGDDLNFIDKPAAVRFMNSLPRSNGINFEEFFEELGPDGNDLMSKMLSINPTRRSSAEECLNHPFLTDAFDERFAIKSEHHLNLTDIESMELTEYNLKSCLMEDIIAFNQGSRDMLFESLEELKLEESAHKPRGTMAEEGEEEEHHEEDEEGDLQLNLKTQMKKERERFRRAIEVDTHTKSRSISSPGCVFHISHFKFLIYT